ncbi:MAG TPA: DoxX family protein [Chthoniobacterales bacterium]|nr:DoxX family protein [Chthoniobacterales bacterium]
MNTRFADLAYCVMRVILGLMFACHGGTKIFGFPASQYGPATNTLGLVTGWIELICGFLMALGLLTRVGAFFASGEMAVAYFMTSASRGFFPIANGGEMAVAYCFIFLFVLFYGPGRWSIDFVLKQKSVARTTA